MVLPFVLIHMLLMTAFNKIKIFRPVFKSVTYVVKDDKITLCLESKSSFCARALTCRRLHEVVPRCRLLHAPL